MRTGGCVAGWTVVGEVWVIFSACGMVFAFSGHVRRGWGMGARYVLGVAVAGVLFQLGERCLGPLLLPGWREYVSDPVVRVQIALYTWYMAEDAPQFWACLWGVWWPSRPV